MERRKTQIENEDEKKKKRILERRVKTSKHDKEKGKSGKDG
jgi:hypothetical protein